VMTLLNMDYSHQEDLAITGGLGSNRDLKE
jgi:hypothetical protein